MTKLKHTDPVLWAEEELLGTRNGFWRKVRSIMRSRGRACHLAYQRIGFQQYYYLVAGLKYCPNRIQQMAQEYQFDIDWHLSAKRAEMSNESKLWDFFQEHPEAASDLRIGVSRD